MMHSSNFVNDSFSQPPLCVCASSVGSSVGASTGAGSSASAGSSGMGGDPLSLIFLVQTIAITAKIGGLPDSYSKGFASGFAMFNLQMAPPKWAKNAMRFGAAKVASSGGRRLASFVNDGTDATEVMRGHFFWSFSLGIIVVGLHVLFLEIAKRKLKGENSEKNLPAMFEFPKLEIKVGMVVSMGAIDASLGVFSEPNSAGLWKLIAGLELACALGFVAWFMKKGKQFQETVEWKPLASAYSFRPANELDTSAYYSEAEVVKACQEGGRTKKEARALFKSLRVPENGLLSYEEFARVFHPANKEDAAEQQRPLAALPEKVAWLRMPDFRVQVSGGPLVALEGKEIKLASRKVAFQSASLKEKCFAMLATPRTNIGKYVAKSDDANIEEPWGNYFQPFTPEHSLYYFTGILKNICVLTALNFLKKRPGAQVN